MTRLIPIADISNEHIVLEKNDPFDCLVSIQFVSIKMKVLTVSLYNTGSTSSVDTTVVFKNIS